MHQLVCTEENLQADAKVVNARANTEVVDTSTSDKEKGVPDWA